MATALITEIQQAQTRLPLLSRADRRTLIVRILRELKTHRREVLGNVPAEHCVWIDRLIASVSSTISEIANMETDIGFGLKKPLRTGKPGQGASRRAQGPRRGGSGKASKADGTSDLNPGFEITALAV